MSNDVEQAYEIDSLIVGQEPNLIGIFSGGVLPHIAVPDAPLYSIYYRSTGETYRNVGGGSLEADWERSATFSPLYEFIQDQTSSSTNGTSFQNKLSLASSNLTQGNYRVQVQYGWKYSNNKFAFEGRVTLNNTVQELHTQTPANTSNTHFISRAFLVENFSGQLTCDLDFRSTKNGKTASIFSALIDLRRIS